MMSAKIKYFKDWDDWHKKWFEDQESGKIKYIYGWPIPKSKKGNKYLKGNQENVIYKYFPEPFLYRGNPAQIKLIFLNINPGGGGPCQDYDKKNPEDLYRIYKIHRNEYSTTIDKFLDLTKLSDGKNNSTTEWYNNRIKWSKSIFEKISDVNILCADLIPWHSKKESDVINYINHNQKVIFERVINPLIDIAKEIDPENPKIIVRGVAFFNLINSWIKEKREKLELEVLANKQSVKSKRKLERFNNKHDSEKRNIEQYIVMDSKQNFFDKFNSYLAKYKFKFGKKFVTFYIFSGGANMDLPNSNYKVFPVNAVNSKVQSLKDFMNNSTCKNV